MVTVGLVTSMDIGVCNALFMLHIEGYHSKSSIRKIINVWIAKKFCRYLIHIWHIYILLDSEFWYSMGKLFILTNTGQLILIFNGKAVHTDICSLTHWGLDKMVPFCIVLNAIFNENSCILIHILQRFVWWPIINNSALVHIMVQCQTGDKPLYEPVMI